MRNSSEKEPMPLRGWCWLRSNSRLFPRNLGPHVLVFRLLKRWQGSPHRCWTCTSLLVDSCVRSQKLPIPMKGPGAKHKKTHGALLELADGCAF